VVAPGETLTSIAARYGVSVHALAAANGITDLNTIYVGQRLVIPAP
jgi:LysM repeat protein